jgi:hypothetical protein
LRSGLAGPISEPCEKITAGIRMTLQQRLA